MDKITAIRKANEIARIVNQMNSHKEAIREIERALTIKAISHTGSSDFNLSSYKNMFKEKLSCEAELLEGVLIDIMDDLDGTNTRAFNTSL